MKINRKLSTASFLAAAALTLITSPYFILVGGEISSNPSDWADFGTYVGGTSTALALIVATLVYAVQAADSETKRKEIASQERYEIAIEKIEYIDEYIEDHFFEKMRMKLEKPAIPPLSEIEEKETSTHYNSIISIIHKCSSFACEQISELSKEDFSNCKPSQIEKIRKRIGATCRKTELELSNAEELLKTIVNLGEHQEIIYALDRENIIKTRALLMWLKRDIQMIPIDMLNNGYIEN